MPGMISRKTIRASDIGAYLYCRRAWWYRLQGYASENKAALDQGTRFHDEHGRRAGGTQLLRKAALLLFLAALGLLGAAILIQFFN
jgi:CRISPR/Cas system-associated exonuclease Cas4 (RecB family)